jgi:hypothetical protein
MNAPIAFFVACNGQRVPLALGEITAATLDAAIAVAACRRAMPPSHRALSWQILGWQRHAYGSLAAARMALRGAGHQVSGGAA